MSTLTEFLLARIAEDEASAMNWLRFEIRDGIPGNYAIPARVLAECEAKRQIVELHEPHSPDPGDGPICRICDGNGKNFYWPCDTLRFLALPYADHPQFDKAWRP